MTSTNRQTMETDEREFKEMVMRHRDMIWSICKRYRLSSAWQTEDSFNEVLCALWQSCGTFDRRSSERTWVFRIANNTMISISRRINNQESPHNTHQDTAYSDEYKFHIADMIEQLEEPDQTIVRSWLYGFKHSETAQIVGLHTGAVSMRLSRALHKLRKLYKQ